MVGPDLQPTAAATASIKVFDPVTVPHSVLEELQELRAEVELFRQENEHLRRENQRLRRELDEAHARLDQARRPSKRQAAPFSNGPPRSQPRAPGRKSGPAHGRHGHRPPRGPAAVDEVLQALLPRACPRCGGSVRETEVATRYQTEIPRRPLIRRFHIHVGRDWSGTMVHDGFTSYDRFTAATHQQRLGHLIRQARELESQATRAAVHYPRKLIALLTEAIHVRHRFLKGEVPAYETLSGRRWKNLDEWFTFLSRPEIEPTNWGRSSKRSGRRW